MEIVQQSLTQSISHFLGFNILSDSMELEDSSMSNGNQSNNSRCIDRQPKQPRQPRQSRQPITMNRKKPIELHNNIIDESELTDKIIIDSKSYPCPCSDCGGDDRKTVCLLDARIVELQNKFKNVEIYYHKKDKQYIITIPKVIKISCRKSKNTNKPKNNNKSKKKNITFQI